MKKVYPSFWKIAVEKYGFSDYAKKLCDLIDEQIPSGRILEVGVGTGYPFANYFSSKGYDVYGIDISEHLVGKCIENFPEVKASVGEAENMKYPDDFFDAAYSFRSTWYFTDILKVINEMIRVTKKGGSIFFDIINADSREIKMAHLRAKTVGRLARFVSNIIKVIKGEKVIWTLHFPETPTHPSHINNYFQKNRIDFFFASSDHFMFSRDNKEAMTRSRLIYIVKK